MHTRATGGLNTTPLQMMITALLQTTKFESSMACILCKEGDLIMHCNEKYGKRSGVIYKYIAFHTKKYKIKWFNQIDHSTQYLTVLPQYILS